MDGRGSHPGGGGQMLVCMFHPFVFFDAKLALVNLSCSERVHESIPSIQAVTDRPRVRRGDAWLPRVISGRREVWQTHTSDRSTRHLCITSAAAGYRLSVYVG